MHKPWYLGALAGRIDEAPDEWIVRAPDGELTARQFAALVDEFLRLLERNVPAGRPFVIRCGKSRLFLPAIVASAIAQRPYVPVAPNIPDGRLDDILGQIRQERYLVFDRELLSDPRAFLGEAPAARTGEGDIAWMKFASGGEPSSGPSRLASDLPDGLLYILFTSGSTGRPKGVMIREANVRPVIEWSVPEYDLDADDVFLNHVPFTFDLSVLDLYATLALGCRVVCVPEEHAANPREICGLVKANGATTIYSTPSMFNLMRLSREFTAENLPSLRRLLVCGEVFPTPLARVLAGRLPGVGIHNLYGPTETNQVTSHTIRPVDLADDAPPLPIGSTVGNTELVLLDENGNAAGGNEGELFFATDQTAAGYIGDPERTKNVFARVTTTDGRVLDGYRTGDLGFTVDGLIHFKGRADSQIKWRGYRIELGDIESTIGSIAGVNNCAALTTTTADGTVTAVTAYISLADATASKEAIVAEARKRLPAYMVPSRFEFMASLPMSAHGKINRRAILEQVRLGAGA